MVTHVVNLKDRANHVGGGKDVREVERVEVGVDAIDPAQWSDCTLFDASAGEVGLLQLPKAGEELIEETSETGPVLAKSSIGKIKTPVVDAEEVEVTEQDAN